jgi:uncharacterized SAM-dependent methyltransferase
MKDENKEKERGYCDVKNVEPSGNLDFYVETPSPYGIILFWAANPKDTGGLNQLKEFEKIQNEKGENWDIRVFADLGRENIIPSLESLNKTLPIILHFSGHGLSKGIVIADKDHSNDKGYSDKLAGKDLSDVLKRFKNIECVVLNACKSSELAESLATDSCNVIGFNNSIIDEDALFFSECFYKYVFSGHYTYQGATELASHETSLNSKDSTFRPCLCRWKSNSDRKLLRGEVFKGLVDASITTNIDGFTNKVKTQIYKKIEKKEPLSTAFSYIGDDGYWNWVALTKDPKYNYYKESLKYIRNSAEAILAPILESIKGDGVDFISFGPGDGAKDKALIEVLSEKKGHHYYYPIDINQYMLSKAVDTVNELNHNFKIKAILADFQDFSIFEPVYQFRKEVNIFSILGNTIGNMADDFIFVDTMLFQQYMRPGDYAIIGIRNKMDKSKDTDNATGSLNIGKRFDFGPLEKLGIPYDATKLKYVKVENYSRFEKAETLIAIYDSITYEGEKHENVRLSYIHEYDPVSTRKQLAKVGFTVKEMFEEKLFTIFVLQKPFL